MIPSENEVNLKNLKDNLILFYFMEKSFPVLEIFNLKHTINFERCDAMMSVRTRARVHFLIYLLNYKPFGYPTKRYKHE